VQWTVDTGLPASSITSGPSPTHTSSDASFTLQCTATAVGGVQPDCVSYEYTISLKSGAVSGCATTQTVTHTGQFQVAQGVVSVTQLRSGENTLSVWALDAAGNRQAQPATYVWTVQLSASAYGVSITGGPPERPLRLSPAAAPGCRAAG
jgi:hypothetical protein